MPTHHPRTRAGAAWPARATRSTPSTPPRQVLAGRASAVPQDHDGAIESLRLLKTARDNAVKARNRCDDLTPVEAEHADDAHHQSPATARQSSDTPGRFTTLPHVGPAWARLRRRRVPSYPGVFCQRIEAPRLHIDGRAGPRKQGRVSSAEDYSGPPLINSSHKRLDGTRATSRLTRLRTTLDRNGGKGNEETNS